MIPEAGCKPGQVASPLVACQLSACPPLLLTTTDMTDFPPSSILPKSTMDGFATNCAAAATMLKLRAVERAVIASLARIVCEPRLQLVLTGMATSKVPPLLAEMEEFCEANCPASVIGRATEGVLPAPLLASSCKAAAEAKSGKPASKVSVIPLPGTKLLPCRWSIPPEATSGLPTTEMLGSNPKYHPPRLPMITRKITTRINAIGPQPLPGLPLLPVPPLGLCDPDGLVVGLLG